jgi:hypothetical protein
MITAALAPLRLMRYFDDADIDGQACLEKSCLKSIDHMDCLTWGIGSALELAPFRGPLNNLEEKLSLHRRSEWPH